MEILQGAIALLSLGLIAATIYLIDKRVGQIIAKNHDKELKLVKTEIENDLKTLKNELAYIRTRLSELSVKSGLKDVFRGD